MLAGTPYLNLFAVWAKRLAHARTRVLVSERNNLSFRTENKPHQRSLPPLLRRTYTMADVITAVSDAVGDDLASTTGLPRESITTIYNPVVPSDLPDRAREPSITLGSYRVQRPWCWPLDAYADEGLPNAAARLRAGPNDAGGEADDPRRGKERRRERRTQDRADGARDRTRGCGRHLHARFRR